MKYGRATTRRLSFVQGPAENRMFNLCWTPHWNSRSSCRLQISLKNPHSLHVCCSRCYYENSNLFSQWIVLVFIYSLCLYNVSLLSSFVLLLFLQLYRKYSSIQCTLIKCFFFVLLFVSINSKNYVDRCRIRSWHGIIKWWDKLPFLIFVSAEISYPWRICESTLWRYVSLRSRLLSIIRPRRWLVDHQDSVRSIVLVSTKVRF